MEALKEALPAIRSLVEALLDPSLLSPDALGAQVSHVLAVVLLLGLAVLATAAIPGYGRTLGIVLGIMLAIAIAVTPGTRRLAVHGSGLAACFLRFTAGYVVARFCLSRPLAGLALLAALAGALLAGRHGVPGFGTDGTPGAVVVLLVFVGLGAHVVLTETGWEGLEGPVVQWGATALLCAATAVDFSAAVPVPSGGPLGPIPMILVSWSFAVGLALGVLTGVLHGGGQGG